MLTLPTFIIGIPAAIGFLAFGFQGLRVGALLGVLGVIGLFALAFAARDEARVQPYTPEFPLTPQER